MLSLLVTCIYKDAVRLFMVISVSSSYIEENDLGTEERKEDKRREKER